MGQAENRHQSKVYFTPGSKLNAETRENLQADRNWPCYGSYYGQPQGNLKQVIKDKKRNGRSNCEGRKRNTKEAMDWTISLFWHGPSQGLHRATADRNRSHGKEELLTEVGPNRKRTSQIRRLPQLHPIKIKGCFMYKSSWLILLQVGKNSCCSGLVLLVVPYKICTITELASLI